MAHHVTAQTTTDEQDEAAPINPGKGRITAHLEAGSWVPRLMSYGSVGETALEDETYHEKKAKK